MKNRAYIIAAAIALILAMLPATVFAALPEDIWVFSEIEDAETRQEINSNHSYYTTSDSPENYCIESIDVNENGKMVVYYRELNFLLAPARDTAHNLIIVYDIDGNYLYGYKEYARFISGGVVWKENDLVCILSSDSVLVIYENNSFEIFSYKGNDAIDEYSADKVRHYNGYTVEVLSGNLVRIDESGNELVIFKTKELSDTASAWIFIIVFVLGQGFFVSTIIVFQKMRRKLRKKLSDSASL